VGNLVGPKLIVWRHYSSRAAAGVVAGKKGEFPQAIRQSGGLQPVGWGQPITHGQMGSDH